VIGFHVGQVARLSGQRQVHTGPIMLARDRQAGRLSHTTYATFLSTSAEFFDPNAMQLHTACSMVLFLPAAGT